MPHAEAIELSQLILGNEIGAIAIDSNVFQRFGNDLGAATLAALNQFKGGDVRVLLPDVVWLEVRAHMLDAATQSTEKVRTALRGLMKTRPLGENQIAEAAAALNLDSDAGKEVSDRQAKFVEDTGAIVLSASDHLEADVLVDMYFGAKPPFEPKKKDEFPDAISLLELEAWAEERECKVLAISSDNGWKDYAANSERVYVVDELPAALQLFQEVEGFILEFVSKELGTPGSVLSGDLERAVEHFLEFLAPDIHAHGTPDYEDEFLGATLQSIAPIDEDDISIIAREDGVISVAISARATVEMEAAFSFFAFDGVDKEWIPVGGRLSSVEDTFDLDIVIEIDGHLDAGEPAINARVDTSGRIVVDFGEISPDYGRD